MHLSCKSALILIFSLVLFSVSAQIPVETWRDHLPYNKGKVVAIANNRVYCATDLALFYYDKSDNAIYTLSKINKLSDLEVGYIAYSVENNKLVIGYLNGNIDIMVDDTKYNFPDVKMKNLLADKSIYHILIEGDLAYISTGFGIVVFNLKKNEFTDTYVIGEGGSYLKVNSTALFNNEIYALTDKGVFKGSLDDPFLSNFENWNKVEGLLNPDEKYCASAIFNEKLMLVNSINSVDSFHINTYNGESWDTLFTDLKNFKSITSDNEFLTIVNNRYVDVYNTNFENKIHFASYYGVFGVYENNENLWVANSNDGLILNSPTSSKKIIHPDGPASKNAFRIYYNGGSILVAPGGYTIIGHNTYTRANVFDFRSEVWHILTSDKTNYDSLDKIRDVVDFASQQNSNHYMAAAWNYGIIEVKDDKILNVFNSENTGGVLTTNIGGITYDNYGNLYAVCNWVERPFVVKTPDNKWYSYAYSYEWATSCKKLINTNNNDKWAISSRGEGIFVWNDNATPEISSDDVYSKPFNLADELGGIIDTRLNDIVQDRDGAIWIGTSNGVAVYDYPEYALFDNDNFYARTPQIAVDGFLKGLLEGENITTIAVDGANRKWLGTEGGGLFLVSPDGTEQLMVWNTDNSKLFSNNILSLAINQKTGEVFIGTDKGIQSYKGTATEGQVNYSNIYAFPNPVKGDYTGLITIRGLMYQSLVKITDISGRKVYETVSNGGDAIWNGLDMTGHKVATGIYLVMCSLPDGTESEVTKILIVK